MIHALRDAVGTIGEVKLGIKKEDVGTHSIRLGVAMAMYLGECPVFMIMLIGRWSSDAFLRYIRKQVMEFKEDVIVPEFQVHPRHSHEDPTGRPPHQKPP